MNIHSTFKKNLNINILQGQYLQNISLFLQLLNLLIIFFYEWRQDTVIKQIQVCNRKKIGILYHWQSNYWHSWTKEQATNFCLPVSWWNKCYETLQCFTISEASFEVRCNECSTFCLLTMVQGDLVDQEVSKVEKRFLITSTQFIYQILYNMQTESKLINSN